MVVLSLSGGDSGLGCQILVLEYVLLTPVLTIKSLGVFLNASLSMKAQVVNLAREAFFHLYQVRQLATFLSHSDLATVIHATVPSRIDYYNSL